MTNFEIITDSVKAANELLFSNDDVNEITISDKYSNTIMTKVFEGVYESTVDHPLEGAWWLLDRIFYYSPLILLFLVFYTIVSKGLRMVCKKPAQRKIEKAKTP